MAEHAGKKSFVRPEPRDHSAAAKIGPRLVSTNAYRPLIQVEGAPDFSAHFERLLTFAHVEKTLESCGALDNALKMAWVSYQLEIDSRDYPPAELLESLDTAIRQTKALLQAVQKHLRCRSIAFDLYRIGEKTVREGESDSAPRTPPRFGPLTERLGPNELVAEINVHRVLERLQRRLSTHRRKRQRPREKGKSAIVEHAAFFFRKYSAKRLTGYPSGHFAKFGGAFYEAVTGEEVLHNRDALQTQIKAAAKISGVK